jgi:dynein heavy chain
MFKKGMDNADLDEEGKPIEKGESDGALLNPAELKLRVEKLIDTSCYAVFQYISQGLFERHKLIFATQLCFRVLARKNELDARMFDFLIRGKKNLSAELPGALSEWLDHSAWAGISALREITEPTNFEPLAEEMIASSKRFREWYELERPEDAGLPGLPGFRSTLLELVNKAYMTCHGLVTALFTFLEIFCLAGDWKKLNEFSKLLIIRCLRTDRMGEALSMFVRKEMGEKYVTSLAFSLPRSYGDASPETPIFFVLSPGVDPVKDTEELGKNYGIKYEAGNLGLVSLGQGQEPVAERVVENAFKNGGWGFLQVS